VEPSGRVDDEMGERKNSKSSTHFGAGEILCAARISTKASAMVPWILPEVQRPKGQVWSGQIEPRQKTGRAHLCLGATAEQRNAWAWSRLATCVPGAAFAT
jgi:hypothetical protein